MAEVRERWGLRAVVGAGVTRGNRSTAVSLNPPMDTAYTLIPSGWTIPVRLSLRIPPLAVGLSLFSGRGTKGSGVDTRMSFGRCQSLRASKAEALNTECTDVRSSGSIQASKASLPHSHSVPSFGRSKTHMYQAWLHLTTDLDDR